MEFTDHLDGRTVASGIEIGIHHVGTFQIFSVRTNCPHDRWVLEISLVYLQRECIVPAFTEIVYVEVRGIVDRLYDIGGAFAIGVHADEVGASLGALLKSGLASCVKNPGEGPNRCVVDEGTIWILVCIVD